MDSDNAPLIEESDRNESDRNPGSANRLSSRKKLNALGILVTEMCERLTFYRLIIFLLTMLVI